MSSTQRAVIGGIDTHKDTHHAAVIDAQGRMLGDAQFSTTAQGIRALVLWLTDFGDLQAVGVEGTGSYGAELTRVLGGEAIPAVEVNRPNRRMRRMRGKSDPIDAEAAARAVQSGEAAATPKDRTGVVEAIRVLRASRTSAVKSRTAALNQLRNLIVTAPGPLREQLRGLPRATLITTCAQLRPDPKRLGEPTHATQQALRALACRITDLDTEITTATTSLTELLTQAAPRTTALLGVSTEHAGQLLTTAGDNPHRLRNEATFAALCAASPIPASSGKTHRHRLNPGGDRHANRALHMIAITRLRWCPHTRAYAQRRTAEGLAKRDIIRCLKRYIAREIHHALNADLTTLNALDNP